MQSANKMPMRECCNWIALCNALKFINHTSTLTGKRIDEKDIDYREMINYIESVSGDIETCFREKGGVPFKYSLNMYLEDSKEITDLSYDFLN